MNKPSVESNPGLNAPIFYLFISSAPLLLCPRPTCIWRVLHLEFVISTAVNGSLLLQIAHVVSPNSEIGAGEVITPTSLMTSTPNSSDTKSLSLYIMKLSLTSLSLASPLALLLFSLLACSEIEAIDPDRAAEEANTAVGCEEGICNYYYRENQKLKIENDEESQSVSVEDGRKLVFTFFFQAEDSPLISDDEFSEYIRFELKKNQTSFSLSGTELAKIKAVRNAECFCFPEVSEILIGSISGEKIDDNTWQIDADVTFDYAGIRYRRIISEEFGKE